MKSLMILFLLFFSFASFPSGELDESLKDYNFTDGEAASEANDEGSGLYINPGELSGGEANGADDDLRQSYLRAKRKKEQQKIDKKSIFSEKDFKAYAERKSIKNLIRDCKKRGARSTIHGACLYYLRLAMKENVNEKLDGTGKINWFGPDAASAGPYLREAGFINLLDYPEYKNKIKGPLDKNIHPGAILQYDGTNNCSKYNGKKGKDRKCIKKATVPMGQGWGHIELYTGEEYCYDGLTKVPGGAGKFSKNVMEHGTGRRKRKLIGVWVKPGAKK